MKSLSVTFVLLVAVGCSATPPSTTRGPDRSAVPEPTVAARPTPSLSVTNSPQPSAVPCPAGLLDGRLEQHDGELVAVNGDVTTRLHWPPSQYRVRETGGVLVVEDASGTVVAQEGDVVTLVGGATGADGAWLVCGEIGVRGPLEEPTQAPVSLEDSDRYWAHFARPLCPWSTHYSSLAEAVAATRLIVRGAPVGVEEIKSDFPVDVTNIAISEVLKGRPVSESPGFVALSSIDHVDGLQPIMPAGEHVWFLVDLSDLSGEPISDESRSRYYLETWHESVYRNIDGRVSVPYVSEVRRKLDGRVGLPITVHGDDFEAFVERIRKLVTDGTGSAVALPQAPSGGRNAC